VQENQTTALQQKMNQALLTSLAGVTAFEAGLWDEVLAMGAESPANFAAATGLVIRLKAEVARLGGDPDALLSRLYGQAAALPAP
jgi:hypothetical protein